MVQIEQRFLENFRTAQSNGARRLVGDAARYDEVAQLAGFQERIVPGAFSNSLSDDNDILALFDHDPKKVLGRTRTKTLILEDRADGLGFQVNLPDTTAGRDALALAERGDLGGASIGFVVEQETQKEGVRIIERAQLFEISIVSSWPAYQGTTVEARRYGLIDGLTPRRKKLQRYLQTV